MNKIHKKKIRELTVLGLFITFIIIIIISFASWNFNLDFLKNGLTKTQNTINKNSSDVAKIFIQLTVTSIIEVFFIFVLIHNSQAKIPFMVKKTKTRYFIQGIFFFISSTMLMGLHNKYFEPYTNLYNILKINSKLDQKSSLLFLLFFIFPIIILTMFISHIYEQTGGSVTSIIIIIIIFNVLFWMFIGFSSIENIEQVLTLDLSERINNLKSTIPIK